MKKMMWCFTILMALGTAQVQAKASFTGQDFSGVYDCTGDDAHEGKYTGTVTMALNREQRTGRYGAYSFKLEVPGFGVYLGEAAAHGNHVAMHFALDQPNSQDHGMGIAAIKKNKEGKLTFRKFYYEPEYQGGNYGTEDCVRR